MPNYYEVLLIKDSKGGPPFFERHVLTYGGMGCIGEVENHISHTFHIGVGNYKKGDWEGMMSIPHFMSLEYIPQEAKDKIINFAKERNLVI